MGIDEVGRGSWAGPLVVGAVVLADDVDIDGLTDSKKLSAKRRAELNMTIREKASAIGLGWVHADEIDQVGLAEALRLATIRAVTEADSSRPAYTEIIIDGTINFLRGTTKGSFVTTMSKADLLIPAVSAASIVAKVARDNYMIAQAINYPEYGHDRHVGYGTAAHMAALTSHGVTPLHRLSFAPIKRLSETVIPNAATSTAVVNQSSLAQTSKQTGDFAESLVAKWLESRSFQVAERNWKTKRCEIDLIVNKDDKLYFVEVKYRSSKLAGDGLDSITPRKIKQMKFAAELYASSIKYTGDYTLAVAAVDKAGAVSFVVIDF